MTRGPRGSRGPAILFIAMTFAELSASLPLNGGIAPHARIARWLPCLSFSMADLYRHLARALLDEIHTA